MSRVSRPFAKLPEYQEERWKRKLTRSPFLEQKNPSKQLERGVDECTYKVSPVLGFSFRTALREGVVSVVLSERTCECGGRVCSPEGRQQARVSIGGNRVEKQYNVKDGERNRKRRELRAPLPL